MRGAGAITGSLVLGMFLIPSPYAATRTASLGFEAAVGEHEAERAGGVEGSASIAGRVYAPDGKPLAGAEVSLAGSGFWPPKSQRSGEDGRFAWPRVPAGVYELRATMGTLASSPAEGILLGPSTQRVFGLRLVEGWTLSGEVRDARNGRGLADARIHVATGLLGAYARRAESRADGSFEVQGIVGDEPTVYVDLEGYVPSGPMRATVEAPDLEVRLEPGATLEGIVVNDRGDPMRGVAVRAFGGDSARPVDLPSGDSLGVTAGPVPPISSSGVRQLALAQQAVTRADGRFRLARLRSGTYTAVATELGYAPAESEAVTLAPGETYRGLRVAMVRGFELRGRVLDVRGRGLEGIPIELQLPSERLPRMTVSTSDGTFAFRAVRGDVEVRALPYDLQPAVASVAMDDGDRRDVELVLTSELVTLRGRVVDELGDGVEGALVVASSSGTGARVRRSAKTDREGNFAVPALPDPPYDVTVQHAGYAAGEVSDVREAEGLEIVLATGVSVTGRVIDDWTSTGLSDARVSLTGPTTFTTRTSRDGAFAFRQVPIAIYELAFRHPDYETQTQRIEVEVPLYVDRPQELAPVRLVPGGMIEGEVRDLYGEPVSRARVSWEDPPNWNDAVSTDSDGRFVLRGVPEGSVWLTAQHDEVGEARSSRPVTVRPQETTPSAYVRLPGRVELPE
ncbi:MAG: carboxypeptidase-like regulatory domain-containing protein [Myxococcota bacterium]